MLMAILIGLVIGWFLLLCFVLVMICFCFCFSGLELDVGWYRCLGFGVCGL